jgi:hypothetical protein
MNGFFRITLRGPPPRTVSPTLGNRAGRAAGGRAAAVARTRGREPEPMGRPTGGCRPRRQTRPEAGGREPITNLTRPTSHLRPGIGTGRPKGLLWA